MNQSGGGRIDIPLPESGIGFYDEAYAYDGGRISYNHNYIVWYGADFNDRIGVVIMPFPTTQDICSYLNTDINGLVDRLQNNIGRSIFGGNATISNIVFNGNSIQVNVSNGASYCAILEID